MNDYYDKKIYIPKVTEKGEIIGKVERWEAHKKGILHKAFSVALFLDNQIILQTRKHPVFDGITDVTASSHPEMKDDGMADEMKAVVKCLLREWNVKSEEINNLKDVGSVYYRAEDGAGYIEHEYCTFYRAEIDKVISPNLEFAYGYSIVDFDFLKKNTQNFNLAPWVKKGINLLST